MRLRLHPDGAKIFDEWRSRPSTSLEDEQLVARLLVEYSEQQGWQDRWTTYDDPDPNIMVVKARDGLFVHIVKWILDERDECSPDEFSLAQIGGRERPAA